MRESAIHHARHHLGAKWRHLWAVHAGYREKQVCLVATVTAGVGLRDAHPWYMQLSTRGDATDCSQGPWQHACSTTYHSCLTTLFFFSCDVHRLAMKRNARHTHLPARHWPAAGAADPLGVPVSQLYMSRMGRDGVGLGASAGAPPPPRTDSSCGGVDGEQQRGWPARRGAAPAVHPARRRWWGGRPR